MAKITRELEDMKTDTREKDLRLQSLQSKVNFFLVSLLFLHVSSSACTSLFVTLAAGECQLKNRFEICFLSKLIHRFRLFFFHFPRNFA